MNIRITLIRGLAGKKERHRGTIKALGLKRIGSSVIKEDNPQIRGMIARVSYMVKVNEPRPPERSGGEPRTFKKCGANHGKKGAG
ncbi:MAG TPA: 50S ribosomal protein L30 [bacterium]|nr:50S ribosomal protein L30 [bacterium]